MNNRKVKHYLTIFVVAALAICLIFIWILTAKVTQLEQSMSEVISLQHSVIGSVDSQHYSIDSAFEDFQKQQNWLGEMNVELIPLKNNKSEIAFKWQIKELASESDVNFYYVLAEGEEYIEVPAVEIGQGLFEVSIPIEQESGPTWAPVNMDSSSYSQLELEDREISYEIEEDAYEETAFRYYVSVTNKDGTYRNGEIETIYLQDFGVQQYGYIDTEIMLEGKNMGVTLHHGNVENSTNTIDGAYLFVYSGQKLMNEVTFELEYQDEYYRIFNIDEVERNDALRYVVKITYSNGNTFEKELSF